MPQFQSASGEVINISPPSSGGPQLDEEDLEDYSAWCRAVSSANSSGDGNNEANPHWGTAGHNFIRLTDARYTDGAAGIRQTELTPREISDILAKQDNDGNGSRRAFRTSSAAPPSHLLRPVFRRRTHFVARGSRHRSRPYRSGQLPNERAAVEHRARHRRRRDPGAIREQYLVLCGPEPGLRLDRGDHRPAPQMGGR